MHIKESEICYDKAEQLALIAEIAAWCRKAGVSVG